MVDDEADIDILALQKFRKEIQAQEYKFFFARNGEQALEVIADNPAIQLVVTDINMPLMNGFELLANLQAKYPYVKAITVSAYGDSESIAKSQARGAQGFISKPIDFNELKELIKTLMVD